MRGRVVCFFCLRRVPYDRARVVEIASQELNMRFRVYVCSKCSSELSRDARTLTT